MGVASDVLQRILCTGGDIVNRILFPEVWQISPNIYIIIIFLLCEKFRIKYEEGTIAFKKKVKLVFGF